jgi:HEAT repeat protein/Cdc6-like AAA superfamily ATPase
LSGKQLLNTTQSIYDAPAKEIYLLENVTIQGRKTELRQLLKLLNLAKSGQPKAALITGDAGIGKSALMETFINLVREGVYCRVLDLGKMGSVSPESLYVTIIDRLQDEANAILDEALLAVNEITAELDLRWERQDLVRAIALVKLQESIGGKDAVSQEQLVKAIRSQVPAIKRLKFSVNESIEKLVDLIVNPWVMVATSILNPMTPSLQEAMRLGATLKESQGRPASNGNGAGASERNPYGAIPSDLSPERHAFSALRAEDIAAGLADIAPEVIDPSQTIIHMEAPVVPGFNAPSMMPGGVPGRSNSGSLGMTRIEGPARPVKDPLIRHLMTIFNYINGTLENIDSALLITVDEWDRILSDTRQVEMKEFMSELLYHITEQKNYHFMVLLLSRTEGESYTLGGALYNQFRTKLLLDALNEVACRKLVRSQLKEIGVDLEEGVHQRMYKLSRGNPYWHLKILSYLRERVESNRIRHVDVAFFDKLGIENVEQLLELSFTRLKLTFLNDEESLYKVLAALIKTFGERSFSANQAIREISASQGFTDGYVFEVLRALFRHDLICEVQSGAAKPRPGDDRLLESRSRRDPHYVIQSRFVLAFLHEKTRSIETDISTDEKLMYLKKIIPLSVKSGELDREKTMEVLALSDAMNKPEIVEFLEDVFIEHLNDDKPVVRVTALNNVALIDSARAREGMFKAMKDEDSMVREYAARNLALLAQKSNDQQLAGHIVDVMLQAIDDESEAVRAQVYATLARYRWHRDLMNVFIKGLSDACETVRVISARNLAEMETASPFVFNTLLDALGDESAEVRRAACQGVQRFTGPEAIEALVKMLQSDTDSGIRALAADSLSHMEDVQAFQALLTALRQEASEDVKLAVARALGKRRGWQTEEALLEAIQNALLQNGIDETPVFVWACIRSLGQVGGTERSLNLLTELKSRVSNTIILSVIEFSSHKISERIGELRQMERQLEQATPLTVAVPSEYEEDVVIPEEELPHVASLYDLEKDEAEGDEVDELLMREAELAQMELNGIELPFERRPR